MACSQFCVSVQNLEDALMRIIWTELGAGKARSDCQTGPDRYIDLLGIGDKSCKGNEKLEALEAHDELPLRCAFV